MNSEIKRLLKLSSIPNFKLSPKEQTLLDAWKALQEPLVIKPVKKMRSKPSKTRSKGVLDSEMVNVSSPRKKVKNVITNEQKTLNEES